MSIERSNTEGFVYEAKPKDRHDEECSHGVVSHPSAPRGQERGQKKNGRIEVTGWPTSWSDTTVMPSRVASRPDPHNDDENDRRRARAVDIVADALLTVLIRERLQELDGLAAGHAAAEEAERVRRAAPRTRRCDASRVVADHATTAEGRTGTGR